MNQRVKAYPGQTLAESQARYEADAAAAAVNGWYPIGQAWDGTTLIVTYGPMAVAQPQAPVRKRRSPWLWVGAIVVGVVALVAVAGGSGDRGATGQRHTPGPTQRAIPPQVMAQAPIVTTRTSVGDTIEITLTVKNSGATTPDIVVGIKDLSRHALFVGCVPECEDLGESFTGQKLRLPGPPPDQSREYTITWQATDAARADWSMWLSADDDDVDDDDPGWEATTVILL